MKKVIAIIILSFLLRFILLDKIPPSLNWDEVSQGYNAYSILKTGRDEWGVSFPLANFRAYGDYPTTFYMYTTIPFVYLFGLNELSVRLPSVIFGSLLPLLIYLLAEHLTRRKTVALTAAFFSAVSPWSILLSRQTIQAIPATSLLTFGILLFVVGMKKKTWLAIIGTAVLGLSAFAYHNTRIFSPLFLVVLLFLYRRQLLANLKLLAIILTTAVILFVPTTLAALSAEGSARSAFVGIINPGAINEINTARGASTLPPLFARLVHNKVTYFIPKAVTNYLGYFSPQFLFLKGGSQYQFSVQGFGIVNPLESLFFYLGLLTLVINLRKLDLSKKVILYWLLLSPLPAAITNDPYQVVRATTMLPAVYLLTAIGLTRALDRKVIFTVFWVIYLSWLALYLKNLFFDYSNKYSQAWQYGYKQVFQLLKAYPNQKVIITKRYGEPHLFYAFYSQLDPKIIQDKTRSLRFPKSDWFWTDKIDQVYFVNDWDIPTGQVDQIRLESGGAVDTHDSILVTSPDHVPVNLSIIKTVYFLDGQSAFVIGRL